MAANLREARRRRILDKGTDRLALITGRIDSLPSHHLKAVSHDQIDLPPTEFRAHATPNRAIRSASLDTADRSFDPSWLQPHLRKCETNTDTTKTSPQDINREVQPPLVPSTTQVTPNSALDGKESHKDVRHHTTKIFTLNNLSSSISASEDIRILSAITIALLVVLSHLRIFSLSDNIMATIKVTKPVYLVLLTDLTILLALILFGKAKKTREETKGAESSEEAYSWAEGLQTGLVLYRTITAALMDCSIYLVVVICGFSLLQGWF